AQINETYFVFFNQFDNIFDRHKKLLLGNREDEQMEIRVYCAISGLKKAAAAKINYSGFQTA
ncbi:MAG: hypothetical protein Q4D78_06645, partial [Neisseria zoodegmatis]|uniref:hypothetical protein n=1 Tax=Neisseria zoodegmatis TaxID=326523 RepID=UPI0026EBE6BC